MVKKVFVILLFCILYLSANVLATEKINLNSKYYGVYTLDNLQELESKEQNKIVPIASLTKIMTGIVCIENIDDLNQTVVVNLPQVQSYYNEEYSVAGLKDGQEISYYDLIATMLIPSGADSASCIALNVFGDYSRFIKEMNDKAKEIGMSSTSFSNPIGADDSNNYSTVYDVALMMKYALENDTLKKLMSEYEYTTKDGSITVKNALFVLADLYGVDVSKITGGKTGMTGDAGYCLASFSENTEKPLICIVLGCDIVPGTLFHLEDSQSLYNYVDEIYDYKNIYQKGDRILTLPTYHSTKTNVSVCVNDDISVYMQNDENIDFQNVYIDYSGIPLLSSKNKIGDVIGSAKIYYKDEIIGDVDVVLGEEVKFSILKWSKDNTLYVILFEIIVIILLAYILKKKNSIIKKRQVINKL